jgi:tetratricopeptide (TPR) repeat protein
MTGYYRSLDEKMITYAGEVVDRIMKIAPDSTPAQLALSSFHMNFTHNWEIAGIALRKVKQREPDNSSIHHQLSVYYFYLADFENAILEELLAQRNDPLQIECILRLGIYYLRARKTDEARRQFSIVIELAPDLYFGYWMLGQTHILESDIKRGIELLNRALELSNEDEWVLADMVRAYALGGDKKAANKVLESLKRKDEEEHLHPYTFVTPYCSLGRLDEAFEWMEKSLKENDPTSVHLFGAEGLDDLRKDPRFTEIIKKYGIDKYYKTVKEANSFIND